MSKRNPVPPKTLKGSNQATLPNTALIAKIIGQKTWMKVSNPVYKAPYPEWYATKMLENFATEYVEYVIAGAVYRVVQRHTLPAYGIDPSPDIPF